MSSPEAASSHTPLYQTLRYNNLKDHNMSKKTSSFIHWLCLNFYSSANLLSPLEDSAVKTQSSQKALPSVLSRLRQTSVTVKVPVVIAHVSCRNMSLQWRMAQHLADTSTSNILYAEREREKHMRCSENYLRIRTLFFFVTFRQVMDWSLLSFVPAGDLHHGVQQQCDYRHTSLLQRDRAER